MRRISLRTLKWFIDKRSGEVRILKDSHGPATPYQLARLNRYGTLAVVEPGASDPVTCGEAAWAIDVAADYVRETA